MTASSRRQLPSVNTLVEALGETGVPRPLVVDAARRILDDMRSSLGDAPRTVPQDELVTKLREAVAQVGEPRLTPVINATGIIIHTGLGRAPLAAEATARLTALGSRYVPVELDVGANTRGRRVDHVEGLLCRLTGAEAATVVNNNAAALLLSLAVLARDREVIVSRGELVEIGGSFRLPDVCVAGGVRLREVGTTNRTRLGDYEAAIGPDTGAILKVHTSNFRVVGFSTAVPIDELSALGRYHGVPVIDDIGSGALVENAAGGLPAHEPTAQASIQAGADVVLFSGDKLLGGPQAGIAVGRAAWVEKLDRHPMMRALRLDKLILAALEATLRLHVDPRVAVTSIPVLRFATTPVDVLETRAERLRTVLSERGVTVTVEASEAQFGGGSLPGEAIPSRALVIDGGGDEATLAARLRSGRPAVLARVRDGAVWIDLRTVQPDEDDALAAAIERAVLLDS